MLDKAAQDDVKKRPTKRRGVADRLAHAEASAVEFAKVVERPTSRSRSLGVCFPAARPDAAAPEA
jgi:hypothetical protein